MRLVVSMVLALVVGTAGAAHASSDDRLYSNQTPYGDAPTASIVAPPAGYELTFVEMVARHGARSLTSSSAEKRVLALWESARKKRALTTTGRSLKADVLAFQAAETRIGYGNLSTVGQAEWTGIGRRFAAVYSDYLLQAQSDGDSLAFVTTPVHRTAQSAAAERGALRAAGFGELDDRSTVTVDEGLVLTSGATKKGNAAIATVRKRDAVKKASRALLKKIYSSSFVGSIKDPVSAAMDVYLLYTTAPGMASDTSVTFAAYVPTTARHYLSEVKDTENFYRFGPGVSKERGSFAKADPVLKSFFTEIDRRLAGGTKAAVLRHAHGETTMPFAARIRITGSDKQASSSSYFRYDRNPWRGSLAGRLAGNIEWAVYSDGPSHVVTVRYHEQPARLAGCTVLAGTEWFYSLDELRRCLKP